MTGKINIHVVYGDHERLFTCSTRREFGSQVARFFGIDKAEMQLFEINKNSRYPVDLNDVKDTMRLEIKKNGVSPISKASLQRLDTTDLESVKVPDIEGLKRKLTDNRVLSGNERKYLLHLIEDFSESISNHNKKRKREPDVEKDTPKVTVNKKVQFVTEMKDSYSQTDALTIPDVNTPSASKDLIAESKRLACSEKLDKVKVRKLMDKTFETRRQFILLTNPVLPLVKEKYPLLFSTDEVCNELNRIFYDKKDEEFLSNITKHSKAILSLVDEDNPLAKTINKALEKAISTTQKNYARQVGALLMISNILHEKRTYLNTEDEPCEKNNFPRIEAPCKVSKLFEDVTTFRIIVEGITLCEPSTFPEAVLCLLASYFLFNISYEERSFNTFVVMEKIFLDANDTDVNDIDEQTSQVIRLIKLKSKS